MIQSVWKNLTGLIPAEHLWCDFKWGNYLHLSIVVHYKTVRNNNWCKFKLGYLMDATLLGQ